ncbi:ankyrin domain containing protein [Nitzschia inconspicua]|uniref:Ankyrin domain containing protein n=1 Tax=Nitzschia inconspicua TaxID=303405 RepID=A0A9K3PJD0_9STRA|nr:ankyrin domain containing protein [Nitzschia inconspicua]
MSDAINAKQPGRDCWRSARERDRRKSRHHIRARLDGANIDGTAKVDGRELPWVLTFNSSVPRIPIVSEYLRHVMKGNRSKFSTTFVDRHFDLLSRPHDIHVYLWNDAVMHEQLVQLFLSWFGHEKADILWKYLERLYTFTFYEFATWCGKFSIVSVLLHGGINPCIRSGHAMDFKYESDYCANTHELYKLGQQVLRRFFDRFPLRLSTYIVTRVVEMRQSAATVPSSTIATIDSISNRCFACPCCDQTVPLFYRLRFLSCQHEFCEPCFWKDMLQTIDRPDKQAAPDVLSCIQCGAFVGTVEMLPDTEKKRWQDLTPNERRLESLHRLHLLPATQQTLKSFKGKKKRASEQDHIAPNWQQAILPSLGSTQDVRMDKFFGSVEMNAIQYVSACLQAGVNVDWVNEYGQTALYIAVWRGYMDMIELLLEFGSDTTIVANGGSTVFTVAEATGNTDILNLLCDHAKENNQAIKVLEHSSKDVMIKTVELGKRSNDSSRLTILIPEETNHPGAGSFMIDDAVSFELNQELLKLFESLPVDQNQKQKKNVYLCSERSYFCDAEGWVRESLEDSIRTTIHSLGGNLQLAARVYPHMRFLNYTKVGTILAPHIDLCRVDPFGSSSSGQRDPVQHASQRSTHTFILYLTDCNVGGETCLLGDVMGEGRSLVLAKVAPRRGRLLLFPHAAPHEGLGVVDLPKILLRGEVQLFNK